MRHEIAGADQSLQAVGVFDGLRAGRRGFASRVDWVGIRPSGGARFLDGLQLFTRLVNIGDVRSLATHPASTTHRQLNPDELAKAGVGEDTVRLSVGIEHIDDLIADLDAALAQA